MPRKSKSLRVYVGCALTIAPDEFISQVSSLKKILADKLGFEILDFIGDPKSAPNWTPQEVWDWDICRCVDRADAMIAILDYPSTGLGIEMQRAAGENGIPLLGVAHREAKVSRLPLGMPHPHFLFQRYNTLDEVPGLFQEFLSLQLSYTPAKKSGVTV